MFALFSRMLKDKYKSMLVYSLTAVGFLELYIAIFPSMSKMSSQLNAIMATMPSGLFKAFNIDPASLSFNNVESLLASKHFSMVWPIMAIILAISVASYLIINEIDKGTSESLMSLPIKRSKLFISRYLTGLTILLVFCGISIFLVFPLAALHHVNLMSQNHITLFIGSFLFAWVCYSIAVLVSTLFSEKSKATMLTGGLFLVSYFINILAELKDSLINLKYLSIFNYYNPTTLLMKNTYPDYFFWAFGGLIIGATIIAFIIFKKRDMSVG